MNTDQRKPYLITRRCCYQSRHVDQIKKRHVRVCNMQDDDPAGAHSLKCALLFGDDALHFCAYVVGSCVCANLIDLRIHTNAYEYTYLNMCTPSLCFLAPPPYLLFAAWQQQEQGTV